MNATDCAVSLIKTFEGLSTTAYKCPAGVWTIGYGHAQGVKEHDVITKDEAVVYLQSDLKKFAFDLTKALNAAEILVNQAQFDALVSFAFNVGLGALIKSTLWKKLTEHDIQGAADQFLRWNKVRNSGRMVESSGLTRRREAERRLFLAE